MTTHPLRRAAPWPILCALLGAGPLLAAPAPEPMLDGFYDRWRVSVSQLMQGAEREAFLALDDDLQREIFIRRFWQARGGDEGRTLARWHQSFEEAAHRFETLEEDRAQALLLAGKPADVVVFSGCHNVLRPLRIWSFGPRPGTSTDGALEPPPARGFYLVFYLESGPQGAYRLWPSGAGPRPLMFDGPSRHRDWSIEELIDYAHARDCFRWSRGDAGTFAAALRQALDGEGLRRLTVPPTAEAGWLDRLAADLGAGGASLPGGPLEIHFPGSYQRKTVVHGRVFLPVEELERNAEGLLFDRVTIAGDVKLGDRLVDAFRVVHLVAGSRPDAGRVGLDFYRRLRPAAYTLGLRVEDANGLGLLRLARPLEVPRLEHEAPAPAGHRLGLPGLTRREVGVLTTFPGVEILPPGAGPLAGDVEVEAVTTGGPIERVEFVLDGAVAGGADEPPWAAVLALGSEPRPRRLEAVAYDSAGRELARGERTLNAHPSRFAVRLVEPLPGSDGRLARVEVDVPVGETLEQVELYVDRQKIATWRGPPFVQPLSERAPGASRYVRAVATLVGGETMEDLVFVHSPGAVERIDVRLVELYTSVHDARGRFVTGLGAEDFRVLEDGVEQAVRRFDTVENLAINVALLMDVSASMRQKIDVATRSALRFFSTVLRPKDRASLLTFNHDVRSVVPFTHDARDLGFGASGFRAWGTTRLLDGLIYALHSFGGLEGKRALVLLSDGQDVDSDFTFKQVLDSTLRSGVAVYPVALGVEDVQTVVDLERLAGDSGGRFFSIAGVSELDRIYRRIEEELRSQYLLVYEPPPADRGRGFRRVEVEVLREGLRSRSIHGYYP